MNAIPVTKPATVMDVFQAGATVPLSTKKNAVAAIMPIDATQNVVPTKSEDCNTDISALAEPVKPKNANFFACGSLKPKIFRLRRTRSRFLRLRQLINCMNLFRFILLFFMNSEHNINFDYIEPLISPKNTEFVDFF